MYKGLFTEHNGSNLELRISRNNCPLSIDAYKDALSIASSMSVVLPLDAFLVLFLLLHNICLFTKKVVVSYFASRSLQTVT